MFYTRLKKNTYGMSLVEILIALVILATAVMPVIGVFSQYYGLATRQLDNETALKLAEAAMNKVLSHQYSDLVKGNSFSMPLDFQTSEGPVAAELGFDGNTGSSGDIVIGKLTYKISIETQVLYIAQNIELPHPNALEFKYAIEPSDGPGSGASVPASATAIVASYSCTDDLIGVKLLVEYGGPKNRVELTCFRANMTK